MKKFCLVAVLFFMALVRNAYSDDLSAQAIQEKVTSTYASLQAYKTDGTVSTVMEMGGKKMVMFTEFTILLKKPNMYLISWTAKNPSMPMPNMSGAVWSDGDQPYLFMSNLNAYSKMKDDDMALSAATGISGGAALTMPVLFLGSSALPSPLKQWENMVREADEQIDGIDCYVISGVSPVSEKEKVWVSKTDYLIMRYDRSLNPPQGGRKIPELTDEKLEESIKAMGMEVTEERKRTMREHMQQARTMFSEMKAGGISKQKFFNVATSALDKKEFQFHVPDGVIL